MFTASKSQTFPTHAAPGRHGRPKSLLSVCLVAVLTALLSFPTLAQQPGAAPTSPDIGPATQPKSFISYFLPTPPQGELLRDAWGATNVLPREVRNGLEDTKITNYNYWDGQIIKAPDGKYHLFASRWNQARGHGGWFGSVAVHAVSDSLFGPTWIKASAGQTRPAAGGTTSPPLRCPTAATPLSSAKPAPVRSMFQNRSTALGSTSAHYGRGRTEVAGSDVGIMARPDGSFEITERDGRILISDKGILGPYKAQGDSVFRWHPRCAGNRR